MLYKFEGLFLTQLIIKPEAGYKLYLRNGTASLCQCHLVDCTSIPAKQDAYHPGPNARCVFTCFLGNNLNNGRSQADPGRSEHAWAGQEFKRSVIFSSIDSGSTDSILRVTSFCPSVISCDGGGDRDARAPACPRLMQSHAARCPRVQGAPGVPSNT
jgi:hypothetical protein